MGRGIWPSTYLHAWNIVESSFVVFGGDVFRVEAPIIKHFRDFALDLEKYKVVQILPT